MTRPDALTPDSAGAPVALKEHEAWVCWEYAHEGGYWKKKPINPETGYAADPTDPETWSSFDAAMTRYTDSDRFDGIGFGFTDSGPFVGIDLDDCRDPGTGEVAPWGKEIVARFGVYAEVSPSGTGIHLIAVGELPAETGVNTERVELYDSGHYFTVTGRPLDGFATPPEPAQTAISELHEEYGSDGSCDGCDPDNAPARDATDPADLDVPDRQLIEKAEAADNGDKFRRLYDGDTSGYPSHSEADAALCTIFAFYTTDPNRIDRLFRNSGLMRDKWDRSAGGKTYGELTIDNAIATSSDTYTADVVDELVPPGSEAVAADGGRPEVSKWSVWGVWKALVDYGPSRTVELLEHPVVDRKKRTVQNALRYLRDERGMVVSEDDGSQTVHRLTEKAP